MMAAPVLSIEGLKLALPVMADRPYAVEDAVLTIAPGETLCVVGESGSGKSMIAHAVMGLLPKAVKPVAGSIKLAGRDLLALSEDAMQDVRGREVGMIFQEPMTSLNPVMRVADQIVETFEAHGLLSKPERHARAVALLTEVGLPEPERLARAYPHELSGGQRQRVMIAMALALEPKLLIADEPTTALDVTTQAQILRLIERLREEFGMAVIMITHDLGVIAEVAQNVLVMYAGRVVEAGTLEQIFYDPQHPYTWGLLGSLTRIDRPRTVRLAQIAGQPPSLISPPEGCHFRPRCPHAFDRCPETPPLEQRVLEHGHLDRCWLTPEQKKTFRLVESGEIGLEEPAA
jgi:peptide/nickel transport system ATP-binding protein